VLPSTTDVHCTASTHAPAGRPVAVTVTGMPPAMSVAGSSVMAAVAAGWGAAGGVPVVGDRRALRRMVPLQPPFPPGVGGAIAL
jgi:hypothetical protein